MCEDTSIADDFDEGLGVVSGGVPLSVRPAETNPTLPDVSSLMSRSVEARAWKYQVVSDLKGTFYLKGDFAVRIQSFHLKGDFAVKIQSFYLKGDFAVRIQSFHLKGTFT